MTEDEEWAAELRIALKEEEARQQALGLRIARAKKYHSAGLVDCIQSAENSPSDLFRPFSMACRWGYLDELSRLSDELDNRPWQMQQRLERPVEWDLIIQPDGYKKWVARPSEEYQAKMGAFAAQQEELAKALKRDIADFERTARNYISFTQQSALLLGEKPYLFESTDAIRQHILLESDDVQDNVARYLEHVDFHDLLMKSWAFNRYEPDYESPESGDGSDEESSEYSNEPYVKDDSVDDEDPNE